MKNLMGLFKRNKIEFFLLIVLFLLIGFIYRGWFVDGIIAKGDLRSWSNLALRDFFSFPSAWFAYEGGGYYYLGAAFQIIHYPFLFFQGLLSVVFDWSFQEVQRWSFFYPFLLFAVLGVWVLSKHIFKNRTITFFAALAYLLNPLMLVYAYVTQFVNMVLSCAFLPWILWAFLKSLDQKSKWEIFKYALLTAVFFSFSLYVDIKIAYVIFSSLVALFLYLFLIDFLSGNVDKWANLKKRFFVSMGTGVVVLVLNLFWLFPLFTVPPAPEFIDGAAFNVDKVDDSFSLFRALTFYLMEFDFSLLPLFVSSLLVLSAILFVNKLSGKSKVMALFFYLWFLIAAFFHKSGAEPFSGIFIWFFKNIPGFQAFRNPSKIALVSVLPWALLFGLVAASLTDFLVKLFSKKSLLRPLSKWISSCLIVFLLFANLSWLTGSYPIGKTGNNLRYLSTFQPEQVSVENLQMEKFFAKDDDKFRILYLPTDPAYGILNSKHTAIYTPDLDPANNPFIRYVLGWRWYYSGIFHQGITLNIGRILSLKNIKYVVFLPKTDVYYKSVGTESESEQAAGLLTLLLKQQDLKKLNIGSNINVFLNQKFTPNKSIYLAKDSFLVNGGLDALISDSLSQVDFRNSVLFAIGHQKEKVLTKNLKVKNVVNVGQDMEDLALSTLPSKYYVNLWSFAKAMTTESYKDKNRKGFWREYENRPTLANTYGEVPLNVNGMIKGSDGELDFNFDAYQGGGHELWLRLAVADNNDIYYSHKVDDINTLIELKVNGKEAFIDDFTLSSAHNLEWIKLTDVQLKQGINDAQLTYHGKDKAIVIDMFAFVPHVKMREHIELVNRFLADKKIFDDSEKFIDGSTGPLELDFTELSPTHYELNFSIKEPRYLVFSDNYDPYWKLYLNGKIYESIKTLSGNNSFYIDEAGYYKGTLEFVPQYYFNFGFALSGMGWVLLFFSVIYLMFKTKNV